MFRKVLSWANAYSSWEGNTFWFSAGFYLNIFTYDLFSIINNVNCASSGDDNTSYVKGDDVIQVMKSLKEAWDKLLYWFTNN